MSHMAVEATHGCRCGRPLRDQQTFCDTCGDQLSRALGEVPWVDAQLALTLTGQRGIDYRALGGAQSSEPKLPIHAGASEAGTNLRNTLIRWVSFCVTHDVRNQSHQHGIPHDNPTAMSRWLLWRIDGLSLLDEGPDAVDDITRAVARGKRTVDRPADKWYAGPCDACGTDLYAKSQAGQVVCRGKVDDAPCKQEYDIAARRQWLLEAAEDRLAPAATLARAVSWLGATPLTGDRVRKWASRGRIMARGHDSKASPLYRIGDAIDLLAADTRRAG